MPLDMPGRTFTVVLLMVGVTAFTFTLASVGRFILEGEFREVYLRRRMEQGLKSMSHHYILCGLGEAGLEVLNDLMAKKVPIAVIERDEARAERLTEDVAQKMAEDAHVPVIWGDATDEQVLQKARIEEADGIVITLPDDSQTVFVILSAVELNPDIRIIAQANSASSAPKLRRAGAATVVTPSVISGRRMAAALVRPAVFEFLDVIMQQGPIGGMELQQVLVEANSSLAGRSLAESKIRLQTGAIILSVQSEGKVLYNPPPDYRVQDGDSLVALGEGTQLDALQRMARGDQ